MPSFAYDRAPHPVRPDVGASHQAFWERLSEPGSSFYAAQRVAIAAEARASRSQRSEPPWLRALPKSEDGLLPAIAIDTLRTIALDAHRIDREWAERAIASLGEAAYVELAAITVQLTAIDAFAEALGVEPEPLPDPRVGQPDGARPDGLGDIGAFVPMLLAFPGPNVGRAMSLSPADNSTFFGLVGSMYAVSDFGELVWKDRPLSRPQVELVAARVSAINECFY